MTLSQRTRYAVAALVIGVLMLAGVAQGYRNAVAEPVVRRADLGLPRWPEGAPPVRVVAISDIHLGNAAMSRDRLVRIVSFIDDLHPDLVVIAGDFIAGSGRAAAVEAAPVLADALRRLRAPLGTVAVLGNHDHDSDAAIVRRALAAAGVTVLRNDAVARGPLAIGGMDDPVTGNHRIEPMLRRLDRLPGARLVLTHSSYPVWHLPQNGLLLLAGHTHCGQIVVPLLWQALADAPDFRCGIVQDRRRTVITSAGLGASRLPIRFGAPPDLWLLTLGPVRLDAASQIRTEDRRHVVPHRSWLADLLWHRNPD